MSGRIVPRVVVLLPIIIFVASCDSPSGTRTESDGTVWQIQMGVVGEGGPSVSLPTHAVRGQPVGVTVMTYGGGCITKGPTYTTVEGLSAIVEPYDSFVVKFPPNSACDDNLSYYPHSTTLTFNQSGAATVLIRGRNKQRGSIVSITRMITVD